MKEATADPDFMRGIIRMIAEAWVKNGNVTIECSKAEELTKFFEANAAEMLQNGVKVVSSKNGTSEFTISPEKGGFKVTIGDEELIAYFKEFVRPKMIELLF